MIDQKDCVIIIPHLGGSPESEYALDQCLQSLQETVPDMKKIVAFNGDEDCRHDYMFGDVRVYSQGQCKAVNAAVATVNTPWVFITNDDMVYAPGWWERLVQGIGMVGEVGCYSPKLVEPRKGAPTFVEHFCGGAGGDFDKQKFVDFTKDWHAISQTGFNLPFLISKKLWDTVEGYDVSYDPWGSNSDSDLEYKIKLAGVQPLQIQECLVYHFSQTSGTFEPKYREYWELNWQYFIKKWGFPRTDNGIWEANFIIPTKEEGRLFNPDWEGKYENR